MGTAFTSLRMFRIKTKTLNNTRIIITKMTVVATPSEGRNSRQILILMEIQISVKQKHFPRKYSNTVSYICLFSRMIPASVQLLEFCLLTENSDVCNSQFCPKANQPTFPPHKTSNNNNSFHFCSTTSHQRG